jgi:hypothetical protein
VGLGLALFELLRRRMSPTAALIGSAATVLTTPLFPYATSFYGHTVAAAFLTGGVLLLDRGADPARLLSRRATLAAGACLAASIGCEYLSAVPVVVVLLVYLRGAVGSSSGPPRARARSVAEWLLLLAAGALVPALMIGGYHWVCFGAPWRTGYSFVVDPKFAAGHASGLLGIRLPTLSALWGLSFGRMRGLFYVSPIALLLLIGTCVRARARDRAALAGLCGFVALLLVNGSYYMWWGGAASAPRHLVPVLGLLGLGLPWLWQHRWLRGAALVLGLVALINMIAISAVGLEAPEHGDVLRDFVYARLLSGKVALLNGASNLGLELGVVRGGSLGPLLVWLLVGAQMLLGQVRDLPAEPSAALSAA